MQKVPLFIQNTEMTKPTWKLLSMESKKENKMCKSGELSYGRKQNKTIQTKRPNSSSSIWLLLWITPDRKYQLSCSWNHTATWTVVLFTTLPPSPPLPPFLLCLFFTFDFIPFFPLDYSVASFPGTIFLPISSSVHRACNSWALH